MTSPSFPPICLSCQWLNPDDWPATQGCKAFPDGIPEAIWVGLYDHRVAFPNDRGVQFQLAEWEGAGAQLAEYDQHLRAAEPPADVSPMTVQGD